MEIIIFIAALAGLNLLAWIFFVPRMINHKISRFQNDLVDRHYDEVEVMYRKMRGWRHDYHNHIQVLKAYLKLGQYGEAEGYLDCLDTDLTKVDTVLKTGNVVVDAILNSKLSLMREKQIRVDATAIVPQEIPLSGVDLAVMIGNLLDNAMEACAGIERMEDRFIRIYIDVLKKQLYVSVTNAAVGKKRMLNGRFQSDKESGHGFGMLRVDSIVSKYHGMINRQTEEGVFATEITLPLSS